MSSKKIKTEKSYLSPVKNPQKLSSYLKREWRVLTIVVLSGLIFNGSMSLIAILQGKLIDAVVGKVPLDLLLSKVFLFVGVVALIQIMRAVKRYSVRLFANRVGAAMRRMFYNGKLSRSLPELSEVSAGDMMNRTVGDVDICVEGMRKVTTEVFDTGVLMIAYFVSMLTYDIKISIIACLFIPLAMFVAEKLKTVIERYTSLSRQQSGVVSELTLSGAENAMLYRAFSVSAVKNLQYDEKLEELEKRNIRSNIFENSMQPIYNVIALTGIVGILILGGGKVAVGDWSVGDFTAYIAIFVALAIKASKAAKLFNTYQKAATSWKRIRPVFTDYVTPKEAIPYSGCDVALECKNLAYSYSRDSELIFDNLDFSAKAGDIIGVTGKVAAGKTALGLALTGVYPYTGSIILCGQELRDMMHAQRSGLISYLGHDPQLVTDSILENIALGDEGDILTILNDVCFEEDLKSMPDGENTLVGAGGVRLSGGQRSRVALSRTIFREAKLIILDDPFSAVDMKTEAKIFASLKNRCKDSIIILISHRLSVFDQTDKLIYLENGTAKCSTHERMLEDNPEYRSLFFSQTGGDLDA